nr:hypothetical protein OG409_14980 [Streptomyces sp. NBC_00974]
MRTATRTSLLTAVLAGALLVPAAGAAYAAAPSTAAQTCVSSATTQSIGAGVTAELTMTVNGPRVLLRTDGSAEVWKVLDRTSAALPESEGIIARIINPSGSKPVFEWRTQGGGMPIGTTAFPALPDGCTPGYPVQDDKPDPCVAGPVRTALGRGLEARLTMSPKGPQAELFGPAERPWRLLNRFEPALLPSDGEVRILNASSAEPVLEWHVQNGAPVGHAPFPALPKGCTYGYTLQKPTEKPRPETPDSHEPSATPSAKPSATPSPAAAKPQTAGQTSVVPKGGVAAGAETTVEDTDNTTTVAAGAGLMAVFGALGAVMVLRRRARG